MTSSPAPDPELELDLSDAEMPDNDQDSDRESLFTEQLAEEDSPVDGYFEQREHPQESFVQHSSVQAESEAKAREAARERLAAAQSASTSNPSRSQHSSSAIPTPPSGSSRSASQWEEDSNLAVDTSAPPPDYETAISDRSSERNSNRVTSPADAQAPRSPADYGTVDHQADNGYPADDQNEAQWPFGNRGNPFANGNFPFGNRGNPFSSGNFTFGNSGNQYNNRGNHFGFRGNPFGFRGNPFGIRGNPAFGNGRDRSSPNNDRNTREEPVGAFFYPAPFAQDHPLVRNGLFSGQQSSDYQTQPESMADSGFPDSYQHEDDEEASLIGGPGRRSRGQRQRPGEWRRSAGQRLRNSSRSAYRSCRSWGIWVGVILLVLLIVLIGRGVYTATRSTESGNGDGGGSGNSGNNDWNLPYDDDWPINPPYLPETGKFHGCYWSSDRSATAAFEKPEKFSFIEMLQLKQDGPQQVWGEVRIRPAPKNQEEAIVAVVSVRTSEEWSVQGINLDMDDSGLELKYPSLHRTSSSSPNRGCMAIGVALQVRSDLSLQDFEVSTAHMKVNILDGFFRDKRGTERWASGPKITHSTKITTINGGVNVEYWNSRETWIDSDSGHVTGSFALLDVLSVHTTNGWIDVTVRPKEVDKADPRPAVTILESRNGHIEAKFPTHGTIPPRDYQTRVESENGGARGTYILGSSAKFTTINGAQKLTVLPYDTNVRSLQTNSKNGGTTLTLLSPYAENREVGADSKTDLSHLQSSHKSTFGSVTLVYPQEWMGTIDAESTFGSVHVHGKDLDQNAAPTFSKRVVAHKGQGDSKMTVRSTGGSIDVLAGDEY